MRESGSVSGSFPRNGNCDEMPMTPTVLGWVPAGFFVEEVDHVHRDDRAVVHSDGGLFPWEGVGSPTGAKYASIPSTSLTRESPEPLTRPASCSWQRAASRAVWGELAAALADSRSVQDVTDEALMEWISLCDNRW